MSDMPKSEPPALDEACCDVNALNEKLCCSLERCDGSPADREVAWISGSCLWPLSRSRAQALPC